MVLYLNEQDLLAYNHRWLDFIEVIEFATEALTKKEFAQPVKPYLRYKNLSNRIIAMPAYLGGDFDVAGIKWIASFPENIKKGMPRANSIVILNDADTGIPKAIINTPLLSIIRTAAVSGFVLKQYLSSFHKKELNVGIIGWGPIGRNHFKMCSRLLEGIPTNVFIYDIENIHPQSLEKNSFKSVTIVSEWERAYEESDIFITCTVSKSPYIDLKPKDGSLHLNVSLRDYKTEVYEYFKENIIVDDWTEICRENTDIERFHLEKKLQEHMTKNLSQIFEKDFFKRSSKEKPIMFNPMGMAIFDMAIAHFFYTKFMSEGKGIMLN